MSDKMSAEGITQLKTDEGYRDHVYPDADGYAAGWGHTITSKDGSFKKGDKITKTQAETWFAADLANAEKGAKRAVGADAWSKSTQTRKDVLINMTYNLGAAGLKNKFPKMIAAYKKGDYNEAAVQMKVGKTGDVDSKWYTQVGAGRADRLIAKMKSGGTASLPSPPIKSPDRLITKKSGGTASLPSPIKRPDRLIAKKSGGTASKIKKKKLPSPSIKSPSTWGRGISNWVKSFKASNGEQNIYVPYSQEHAVHVNTANMEYIDYIDLNQPNSRSSVYYYDHMHHHGNMYNNYDANVEYFEYFAMFVALGLICCILFFVIGLGVGWIARDVIKTKTKSSNEQHQNVGVYVV